MLETRYVLCLSNAGYKASLVVRRIYKVIADEQAERRSLIRVVDESGEDYLFPRKLFVAIELPRQASRAFSATT